MHGLAPMDGVPIIVASAPRSQTELMRLLANGARRWFRRPPAAEELMEAIQECLDRSGALSVFDVDEPVVVNLEPEENWLLGAAPEAARNAPSPKWRSIQFGRMRQAWARNEIVARSGRRSRVVRTLGPGIWAEG